MMTEEKIYEVKRLLKKGEPEGEIRESLKREGFTKAEIESLFKPHHYDMRSWYLIMGIVKTLIGFYIFLKTNSLLLLIIGGGWFVAYYYEEQRLNRLKN